MRIGLLFLLLWIPSAVWAQEGMGIRPGEEPIGRYRDPKTGNTSNMPFTEDQREDFERHKRADAAQEDQRRKLSEAVSKDEERRVKLVALRDPSDIVAQVLNYTSTGYDEGDGSFWVRPDETKPCAYEKVTAKPNIFEAFNGLTTAFFPTSKVDFTIYDPSNLTFENSYTNDAAPLTVIKHEGNIILVGQGHRDVDRVVRGWKLVYTDHCKAF